MVLVLEDLLGVLKVACALLLGALKVACALKRSLGAGAGAGTAAAADVSVSSSSKSMLSNGLAPT